MNDELDIAAAEYVLGTLPADERARFAARLETDGEARAHVAEWQARLAPLHDVVEPKQPPAGVWQGLEAAIAATTAASSARTSPAPDATSNVVQLRRRVAMWRGSAMVTGALAAGLAAMLFIDRTAVEQAAPPPVGGRYVAVVDTGGREPALIAEVDTGTGIIQVRSLTAEVPAGHSLELWHVADDHEPRSLGVLQAGANAQTIRDAASTGPVNGVIAVTVEPEGGSPSGAPTGPIVYSGRLVPVD